MEENQNINQGINQNLNDDDFNISITNEHNEQELTSMGETGKSSGIISAANIPHFNFSVSNKNKLYTKQTEPTNHRDDNYSTYTNIKNNDKSEVRLINFIYYFQYRKLLALLEKKEMEKKSVLQIYNQKLNNYSKIKGKVKENKEKLDMIRRKNEYLKLLICKLMKDKK